MATLSELGDYITASADELADIYGTDRIEAAVRRYRHMIDRFSGFFDGEGSGFFFASAGGRTELGGNHTDHNGGRVLAAAVTLDCLALGRPRSDAAFTMHSQGFSRPFRVDLSDLERRKDETGTTEALIRGVARGLADRGVAPRGFDLLVHSDVTPGSGLSSSAALEMLLTLVLSESRRLPPLEMARLGQWAENEYFGKPCGLMDQASIASGGVVAIDFAHPGEPAVTPVSFQFAEAGMQLVVVDTGGDHSDLTADYAAIPEEMRRVAGHFGRRILAGTTRAELLTGAGEIRSRFGDRAFLRALHFVEENQRVQAMVAALQSGEIDDYLALVDESGRSSWELLQNYSPSSHPDSQGVAFGVAVTRSFLAARGAGGAARVHGGGFAGTIQAYVPTELFSEYRSFVETVFGEGCATPLRVRPRGPLTLPAT